jgi:hypothetical protein
VVHVQPVVGDTAPLEQFPALFQRFAAGETLKVHLQASG